MTDEAFTLEGHPCQIIGFTALFHVHTPITSFIPPTLLLETQQTQPHARETFYQSNLLSSFMIEQTIIQAEFASIETFDGTKSKFEP